MTKRHFVLFSMLEVTYWGFHASFIGYAAAYMLSRGVSNTAVSLLLAGYLLCAFIGSVIFGSLCDRFQTNKRVFIPGMLAAYAMMFAIYFCADRIAVLAVCYPLLGFFFQPQGINADAWVLSAYDHDQKIFGRIRSLPSLFYAIICAAMGKMISVFGYPVMLISASVCMAMVIASAALLPDARAVAETKKIKREDFVRLFSSGHYRRLVVLLFLIGLAAAPINNLKIVLFEHVGGGVTHVGADAFVSAMIQVPFIAAAGALGRIALRKRYMAMAFLPLAMILIVFAASSPAMIFAGSFCYNAAYGVILVTMREVTERYVDKDLRNLGHNLSDAVFNSFSGVISLMCAGAIIDGFGVSTMILISAAIASIPAVMSMKKLGD